MAGTCDAARMRDQLAIADLLAEYADIVTRMAPDDLRRVFVEEAVWTVTGWGEPRGHDEIIGFLAGLLDHWQGIVHVVHHGRVEFDEHHDDRARGWWVITEEGVREGAPARFTGVYHDEYRRDADGSWRFASRRYDGLLAADPSGTTSQPFPADVR